MPIMQIAGFRSALGRMQITRGLRAGLAVGAALLVCLQLHRPTGWAALGALYVCLVDNGGPYRLRLHNMRAVFLAGSLAVMVGSLSGGSLRIGLPVTLAFCFCITLARVLSQPMAASSVFVLICYIVAYGTADHGLVVGTLGALSFLLGGLWASLLALVLWPVDPFRPARLAVAGIYATLIELAAALPSITTPEGLARFNTLLARTRHSIETAQAALAATPARMTVRTVRARNLTVLTESADLLLARILRFAELAELSTSNEPLIESCFEGAGRQPRRQNRVNTWALAPEGTNASANEGLNQGFPNPSTSLEAIHRWLTTSLTPIEQALRDRPLDDTKAFTPNGSHTLQLHRSAALLEATLHADPSLRNDAHAPMIAVLRDSLYNIEIAFESIRAIWTGAESRQNQAMQLRASLAGRPAALSSPLAWLETLRSNCTLRSVMFRYALRIAIVVTIDTILMRYLRITHGYWLAMTSLIVLRPFAGETVRRSAERVAGTVAGGILAAAFTAVVSNHTETMFLIVLCSAGSVAFYSVDYAWYCFFLTPAIVLLTLPRLHDWHLAVARTEMTVLGALIAVIAMLLLWPERESLQLPRLLGRGAAADAAYLRATLAFWQTTAGNDRATQIDQERTLLAPARRLCGLAANDAEETLDHALLEHDLPLNPRRAPTQRLNSGALTFTTYLRRLTRTTTTLAAVGLDLAQDTLATATLNHLATRLEAISHALSIPAPLTPTEPPAHITELPPSLAADQIRRIERQVSILERTTTDLTTIIR